VGWKIFLSIFLPLVTFHPNPGSPAALTEGKLEDPDQAILPGPVIRASAINPYFLLLINCADLGTE
jgi:hypothetical protein